MSLSIKWLGHAGFRIAFTDPDGETERIVYIDTWLDNPKLPEEFKGKVPDDADLVLVTHGHFDHSASSPAILRASKKEHCETVTNGEISRHFVKYEGFTEKQCNKMNKGGTLDYGWCKIHMTGADHSSCCMCPMGNVVNGGEPNGFVLHVPHLGARIYHAGDTNVFTDMGIIEELNHPNILLVPIGDRFTMGPDGAALACSRFFPSAKYVMPMHYGTFPLLTGTFEKFKEELEKRNFDLSKLLHTPDFKDGTQFNVNLATLN